MASHYTSQSASARIYEPFVPIVHIASVYEAVALLDEVQDVRSAMSTVADTNQPVGSPVPIQDSNGDFFAAGESTQPQVAACTCLQGLH
jgi:hypothetical protein